MLTVDKVQTYGWEAAVRGMRNPMNSWEKSDSFPDGNPKYYNVGPNDLDLMQRLVKAGTDHSKFMRMIGISMDILAPLYWWKEFDTYKVGTVSDSCSTMHKIHENEFTVDDFSHEHLVSLFDVKSSRCAAELPNGGKAYPLGLLNLTVDALNNARQAYLDTGDKDYWWQLIQLLPSSYNQLRTVTLNYAVARNIYHARKNHKLDEWHTLCEMLEALPYSELITL